ncbi:UDP-glucuronosyltransferase 2B19 [Bienertia sinuspersici]
MLRFNWMAQYRQQSGSHNHIDYVSPSNNASSNPNKSNEITAADGSDGDSIGVRGAQHKLLRHHRRLGHSKQRIFIGTVIITLLAAFAYIFLSRDHSAGCGDGVSSQERTDLFGNVVDKGTSCSPGADLMPECYPWSSLLEFGGVVRHQPLLLILKWPCFEMMCVILIFIVVASSCDMKLLNSTAQLVEPLESRKFARFSLSYTEREEKPEGVDYWEPRFAGHQSWREREESLLAHDQKINCGFIKGPKEYPSTGFDLAGDDYRYVSKCHIAVVSCIFGNSDRLKFPFTNVISRLSRKRVCFVMFMDDRTLRTIALEGQIPDRMGFIGLWKVVVVKNLPYTDMRRVGKIPKLLPHRLFPSARYSIWVDSKLRLQRDPLLVLERFLWREGHEYAIADHYARHCVWEEVARNKVLNKYNHTKLDQQLQFYEADGLKKFNASDPEKLLPSNVPEASLIIRAHTPMSNLFSCLWFNEVDRFTSRDQLSFMYTYQKLIKKNPGKSFYLHMFKDCERRQISKLFSHRSEEKRRRSATQKQP